VLLQLAPEAAPDPPDIPGIGFEPLPEPDVPEPDVPEPDAAPGVGGCEALDGGTPDAGWLARLAELAVGVAVDEPFDAPLRPPVPLPDPAWPPPDEPLPAPVVAPDPACAPVAPSLLAGAAVSC
jgi:hypothetical protein